METLEDLVITGGNIKTYGKFMRDVSLIVTFWDDNVLNDKQASDAIHELVVIQAKAIVEQLEANENASTN